MSPSERATLYPWDDEEETPPFGVQLASGRQLDAEQTRHDRRAYQRLRNRELQWVRNARIASGRGVSLVDLSAGGALLDSPAPLRPDSLLTLEIAGGGFDTAVRFRVLRCEIGALMPERTIYRGACEFVRVIELPGVQPAGARVLYPGEFVGLDLALKRLAERVGPVGDFRSLDSDTVCQALETLRARALRTPTDPIGNPLAGLLAYVVPALQQNKELAAVLRHIEAELRLTIPQVSLRLTGTDEKPAYGVKSILINVPGAAIASALVSIDLPRGVVLNAWQSRVLRVTSRLIALLQRLGPERRDADLDIVAPQLSSYAENVEQLFQVLPASRNVAQPFPAVSAADAVALPVRVVAASEDVAPPFMATTASQDVAQPFRAAAKQVNEPQPQDLLQPTTWQKIVVRYAEGQILKGYTQDFSAIRSQFSLWPSLTAAPQDRVVVPLARLKGVFFVRDFDGNPGYVERTDNSGQQPGRRIEVTLVDDEVIVGTTLNYRPDGYGFFIIPVDPLANNIRVFIVAGSVRQVRFP